MDNVDMAYLSIDLDYWIKKNKESANIFFDKIFKKQVPTVFVIEHEELLKDIDNSNCNILYNVDFHSDICADVEIEVDEDATDGTWVNFVNWRFKGQYVWICPNITQCYNAGEGTCCADRKKDPFKSRQTGWKSVSFTQKQTNINWKIVKKIGICLSPLFVNLENVEDILSKFKVNKNKIKKLVKTQSKEHSNRHRGVLFQHDCIGA
jgi:ribosomal protein S17E